MDDHRGISKDPFWAPIILPEKILTPYRAVVPEKLLRLGFSETWLRALEIGTDFHNHRIIYPVRDLYGHLAGCVGGIRYPGQYPKYKPYEGSRTLSDGTTRESEYGTWFDEEFPDYHFAHHRYLWNFDRAYPSLFFAPAGRFLVLTEGFKACLWTLQSGVPLVSALMGSAVTEEQHQLLLRISTPIIFFLDNNEAGIQATLKYGAELFFTRGEVYVARYPDQREQPDNLTGSEVLRAVYEPEHFLAFSERRSRSVADRASILTPNNMRQI
jgi:DNA primase